MTRTESRLRRTAAICTQGLCLTFCMPLILPASAQQVVEPRQEPRAERRETHSGFGISLSVNDLLRGASALARAVTAQDDAVYETGQLLVLWADAVQAQAGLDQLAQREQLRPTARHALASLGGELAVFQFATQAEAERWRTQLRASYPDWIVDFNARAESLQAPQWSEGGAMLNPANAASAPSTVPSTSARLYALRMLGLLPRPAARPGPPVRIGVIDTPLAPPATRPDRRAGILDGGAIVEHSVLAASDIPASSAHGTAVAQLLFGRALKTVDFVGSAPPGPVWWATALRQVGERQSTNTVLLAQAFDWLASQRVQLLNLSAGGAGDDILKAVTARLLALDITLVAAAGNRPDAKPVYPAAYAGVWAVGAVDAARQRYSQGSRGDYLSFAAPGVDVWVPDIEALAAPQATGAEAPGRYLSGTSFAAALATGTLAWLPPTVWAMTGSARLQRACQSALPVVPMQGCGLLQATR